MTTDLPSPTPGAASTPTSASGTSTAHPSHAAAAEVGTSPFAPPGVSWRKVTDEGISPIAAAGRTFLTIEPRLLTDLAATAFHDISFFLRPSQFEQWARVLDDPQAHPNEKFVVGSLIRNAVIAAEGVFPLCQDTGTATILAKRGEGILTGGDDETALSEGIAWTFRQDYLRASQMAARDLFEETNTGTNLPAQIEIGCGPGAAYDFLFLAKGGGSSNKTALYQETKALLTPQAFEEFLRARLPALGVAACPPYHLAVVVGGTSPEMCLKMLKLATAGALDHLPTTGDEHGRPFRDPAWEAKVMAIAADLGLGAQFGGRWLALDARVIRLPRHAGSCPVAIGVSCSAHRQAVGRITASGAWLEQLETDPARWLDRVAAVPTLAPVRLDLNRPLAEIRADLARLPVGTLLSLTGPMVVARDVAHARLNARLQAGQPLPEYFLRHPVYYAGPARTPPGYPIGSFGPTTAQRMDDYLARFMAQGGSLITLAKGNRAAGVTQACQQYGGFYLGTIGGAAALLAREHIRQAEIIDFPDLGMEAVRRIEVQDLPAFLVVDDRGHSLYSR
ncbi:MAG: Fumarate hydratase class I, aerobic [Candidatus Ozemobacter sibiricus]|uniref:Fumarate hydratase class I n=1 Tax=Candidatus Ozemobacter sibiricus TaxID=2268124 RepID=A0A367ZU86_9BACT|nr:MAG: Fumarate hydratase class I, aerobic [Candidatus Ozemobacter sibiricus]